MSSCCLTCLGHLTDSQGRKVDFRNTLVIMTSNLGADILAALPEGVPSMDARPDVMRVVQQSLAPEFLNRIDEIVCELCGVVLVMYACRYFSIVLRVPIWEQLLMCTCVKCRNC